MEAPTVGWPSWSRTLRATVDANDQVDHVDLALLSLGAVEPSFPLEPGHNFFVARQLKQVRKAGAVGGICMRHLGADGEPVSSPLHDVCQTATHLDECADMDGRGR